MSVRYVSDCTVMMFLLMALLQESGFNVSTKSAASGCMQIVLLKTKRGAVCVSFVVLYSK